MAVDDVITLAEAKAQLRIPESDTSRDALIAGLIPAVTRLLEAACKTSYFVRRTVADERHTGGMCGRFGGARRIYLRHYPVVSIIAIEDEAAPANRVPPADYLLHREAGILEHYWTWPAALAAHGALGWWKVSYQTGWFASTAEVDPKVKLAAGIVLERILENPEGAVASKGVGSFNVSYARPEDLPPEALLALGQYVGGTVQ